MKNKKTIIAVVLLIVAGAVAYGFYKFNEGRKSIAGKTPDYTMSAEQLLAEFEQDEELANKKYLDRIVMVSGTINAIGEDAGQKTISLDTGNPMSNITCQLERAREVAAIKEGDQVKVKGICTGMLMDVVLVDCVVE